MRVNSNGDVWLQSEVSATRSKASATSAQDELDASQSTHLNDKLKEIPLSRPDKVAHARALLADPSFPGDVALEKVAGLMAKGLGSE